MRPAPMLAVLLLALPTLADEPKPWPQQGDTVYVSAKIQARLSAYIPQGTEPGQLELQACVPLTVVHRSKGKFPGWGMSTADNLFVGFRGELWIERFHRGAEECRAAQERLGEAKTSAAAGVNIYSPEASKN